MSAGMTTYPDLKDATPQGLLNVIAFEVQYRLVERRVAERRAGRHPEADPEMRHQVIDEVLTEVLANIGARKFREISGHLELHGDAADLGKQGLPANEPASGTNVDEWLKKLGGRGV
jgi:hypothetical protein